MLGFLPATMIARAGCTVPLGILPPMPEAPFSIHVHRQALTARLDLVGAFDLEATPRFREAVAGLHDTGVRQLVVDLRGLDFIDSRGLQELVLLDAEARQNGHNVALVRNGGFVDEPFRLTGLDERFVFVDDPAELTSP